MWHLEYASINIDQFISEVSIYGYYDLFCRI